MTARAFTDSSSRETTRLGAVDGPTEALVDKGSERREDSFSAIRLGQQPMERTKRLLIHNEGVQNVPPTAPCRAANGASVDHYAAQVHSVKRGQTIGQSRAVDKNWHDAFPPTECVFDLYLHRTGARRMPTPEHKYGARPIDSPLELVKPVPTRDEVVVPKHAAAYRATAEACAEQFDTDAGDAAVSTRVGDHESRPWHLVPDSTQTVLRNAMRAKQLCLADWLDVALTPVLFLE